MAIWEQRGWVRAARPPLWMMTRPIQHFQSARWQLKVVAQLAEREGFRGAQFVGCPRVAATAYLFPPEETRYNVAAVHSVRESLEMVFYWVMEMGVCFGIFALMALDRNKCLRCLLWHGWLPGLGLGGERDPWDNSPGQLAVRSLESVLGGYLVDSSDFWSPPDIWDAEDLAIKIGDFPRVWTDGGLDSWPSVGVSVAGAGVYLLVHSRRCSVRNSGVLSWLCKPSGPGIWVLIISLWSVPLLGCWIMVLFPSPCLWLRLEIFLPLSTI